MTKFIALVSGKGGVGKTTCTLNVGQSLAKLGKDVVLLDANIVTPNLAIHLGHMNPEGTLNKFLRKEKSLKEIMYLHESGISLIPSSPSLSEYQRTNPQKLHKVFDLLKNAAGYDLLQILKNTDEVVIVTNPNLSSVMDALKTIQLAKENNNIISGIILNMSNGGKDELLPKEVESILEHPIIANIKYHRKVRKAAHRQMPLTHLYPRSKPAREFMKVAQHLTLGHR